MSDDLCGLLGLCAGDKLAVVGCGGKTTAISLLARQFLANNAGAKVLMMPTTKTLPPRGGRMVVCDTSADCLAHRPAAGLQCLGVLNRHTGKLEAPPEAHWRELTGGYDLVLMEADGSAGLFCKGWREDEPAVPGFASATLGVVNLGALGQPATEENVLRLPEFLALTGLRHGDTIGHEVLAGMVCAPGGMLKNAAGRRWLFINGADNEAGMAEARRLAGVMRARHPQAVPEMVAGSLRGKRFAAL